MVEFKIELTCVKFGAAYYGIVDVERKMELKFVKLGAAYYGMWQSMIIIRASIDALCRDDTDQISRDPHT